MLLRLLALGSISVKELVTHGRLCPGTFASSSQIVDDVDTILVSECSKAVQ
jgi:hypothetical protein